MDTNTSTAETSSPATPPLVSALDAEVDIEVLKAVPKAFEIDSEGAANWLVRKVISARQYASHVKDWAERERRRAEREEMTLLFLYGRQLERWTREQIELLGGRRKSICLPSGTLSFRKQNVSLVIDDEAVLLEWARRNVPTAIQKIEKLMKMPINQHFAETGELPDGTHLQPEYEKFSIG